MNLLRAPLLPSVLVLVAIVLAFVPAMHGNLFYDDVVSLTQNPALKSLNPLDAFDAPPQSTLAGRPVVAFTFALNTAIAHSPESHRFGNILLHIAAALVAFDLIRRLLERTPHAPAAIDSRLWAHGIAWCIALLWAVHPIQTDAVSYAIQRTEILVSLLCLIALHALVRGWTSERSTLATALIAAVLAAGSKEVAAALPLLVAVVHRAFFCSTWREAWTRERRTYLAMAAATWIPLALLITGGARSESVGFGHGLGAREWLLTQSEVIPYYLSLVAWPNSLAVIYEWPVATSASDVAGGLAWMTLLIGATLWALVRAPRAGAAAAAVFLVLAPTSSFVPIWTEVVAERRMYLPSLALIALCVVGSAQLVAQLARPRAAAATAMVAMVALAGVLGEATHDRAQLFGDSVGLWEETTAHQPNSAMAHLQHGRALRLKARMDEAIAACDRALAIDPQMSSAWNNRGTALMYSQRAEESLSSFDRAIALEPDSPVAYINKGLALNLLGRAAEAVDELDKALAIKPDHERLRAMRESLASALEAQSWTQR